MFQKCSWPIVKQWIKFSGGVNYHSKSRSDFSRGANHRVKIQDESSSKANYHSKNCVDQNNRCHKNVGKLHQNIVSSKISSKSHEKPGILSKFVCITFAQYCNPELLFLKLNVCCSNVKRFLIRKLGIY